MSYAGLLAGYDPAPVRRGAALALGCTAAIGGAVAVGVFSGFTRIQSTYAAILLGWVIGLIVCRAGRDRRAAAGAVVLALAGSATASVIAVCIMAVRDGHVPAPIVATRFWHAIPLLPHVIGWFGFVCWALAALVSWQTVRRRGRKRSLASSPATPQLRAQR
jgi:hypothetical protein